MMGIANLGYFQGEVARSRFGEVWETSAARKASKIRFNLR